MALPSLMKTKETIIFRNVETIFGNEIVISADLLQLGLHVISCLNKHWPTADMYLYWKPVYNET